MNLQRQPYSSFLSLGVPNRRGGENIADYSPFGVLPIAIRMNGRTVSLDNYRYGYNGSDSDRMESDDETKASQILANNSYVNEVQENIQMASKLAFEAFLSLF